ncbi:hypothetical protein EVAR_85131_1 [Eumeta japonica]|uniref:Uncharacterized protein n=1 Tax=Eumeta variegata TaxID=151549 RepID=A0A4C1XS36_EUMVA|nr:hypothetical protein EVAR_85131_1 [Eumeta japonica]
MRSSIKWIRVPTNLSIFPFDALSRSRAIAGSKSAFPGASGFLRISPEPEVVESRSRCRFVALWGAERMVYRTLDLDLVIQDLVVPGTKPNKLICITVNFPVPFPEYFPGIGQNSPQMCVFQIFSGMGHEKNLVLSTSTPHGKTN